METEPTTLAHAVQIANSNTTLVSQIFLLEDITVSADSLPLPVNNAAYITSLNPQNTTCSITPDGPCTSLFIVNGVSAILNVYNVKIQANTEGVTNSASEGLIQVQSGFLFMNSSFIQNNNAGETARGGGIYAGTNTGIYLFNTTVQNCSAHLGGGLFLEGVINELEGVTINACSALADTFNSKGGLGGGIFIRGGQTTVSGTIKDCKAVPFEDPELNTHSGGFGGAVYIEKNITPGKLYTKDLLLDSGIESNPAYSGGGVYVGPGGTADISATQFNAFTAAQRGGAVYIAKGGLLNIGETVTFTTPYVSEGIILFVEDYSLDSIRFYGSLLEKFSELTDLLSEGGLNPYLFKGKGTEEFPYKISTTNDIRGMAKVPVEVLTGTWFEQKNNITFDENFTDFSGIPYFSGTYIGNNNYVNGPSLQYPGGESFGFFSELNGATVTGLFVDASASYGYDVTPAMNNGLLVGSAVNSTIDRCGVIGSITDYTNHTTTDNRAGGLIGYAENTSITKSFAAVELLVKNTRDTGGLVGYMNGGRITDCYTAEYVTGGTHVGSMIGYTGASGVSITASYAASEPGVDDGVPADVGFIGFAEIPAAITQVSTYSYNGANTQSSGDGINALIVLNDNNIKKQGSYTGFNFSDEWVIIEDNCAPFLKWQALFYKPLYDNPNI